MNIVVVYNLDFVVHIVIRTTLSKEEVVRKAIEFKENGGVYEYDFVEELNKYGYAEIIESEAIDFNHLDEYLDE